jgi:hypothetical protein
MDYKKPEINVIGDASQVIEGGTPNIETHGSEGPVSLSERELES